MIVKLLTVALAVSQLKISGADNTNDSILGVCPEPTHPDHGKAQIEKGVITKGMAVKYTCDQKYSLMGSGTRHCQETGIWSGEQPTCEFLCSFPPLLRRDGLTSEINPGRKDPLRDTAGNVVLQEIAFSCSVGYTMSGAQLLRCLGDAKWDNDPPTCEKAGVTTADCIDFGLVENGKSDNKRSAIYPVGMIVTFECNAGYRMKGPSIIVCAASGQWSAPPPECVAKPAVTEPTPVATTDVTISVRKSNPPRLTGCPKPLDAPHGTYGKVTYPVGAGNVPADGPFPVNTVMHFECEQFYVLSNGGTHRRTTRTCFRSGEWSGREPYCVPVCGKSERPVNPQVVGGWAASPNEFPWQAALTYRATTSDPAYRKIICGAVLLSERWAVTAAHCVHVNRTNELIPESAFLLFFGKHFYNRNLDDNDVDTSKVAQIIPHDNYDPRNLDYDIALLLLEKSLHFTPKVLPVCLPESAASSLDVGTNGTVSGWGYIDQDGTSPKQLMTTQLPVVDNNKCEKTYPIKVTDRMFCAGFDQGGTNACEGDSGGPFVVWENDRYILQGLVSWGNAKDCAGAGFYGAFVRVSQLVDWIRSWVGNPTS